MATIADCTRYPVAPPTLAAPPARTNALAPFIVCADAHVYHLSATDADGEYQRLSLCGQVAQHSAGGRYRSGRPKPAGAWATPHAYRCCSVCATIAQAQDEVELSRPARLMARLLRMASRLGEDHLWGAASYAGPDWRKVAGREAAKLELDRRLREQVGRKAVAA